MKPPIKTFSPPRTGLGSLRHCKIRCLIFTTAAARRIAEDNDWKDSQEVAIEASGFSPSDSREAAIMSVLAPGANTAIVRGIDDTIGVTLVEVYNLH